MAARAAFLAIELHPARDRIGRRRLGARAREHARRERDHEKPHHPRVNSTAALHGATVVLGDRAILRAIDLELRPGVTVVRGLNGSGKTTLLDVALTHRLAAERGEHGRRRRDPLHEHGDAHAYPGHL